MLNPSGICQCGCGQRTKLATYNAPKYGIAKGQPLRYVRGHENRQSPVDYVEEDRGHGSVCWIWQLATGSCGYGITKRGASGRRAQAAHRFYYQQRFGALQPDVDLHHRCEVRLCVNPDHLEPVTELAHLRHHSVLTEDDVREIRRRYVPRKVTQAMLADEFGTSKRNIKHIIARTTWQEVSA